MPRARCTAATHRACASVGGSTAPAATCDGDSSVSACKRAGRAVAAGRQDTRRGRAAPAGQPVPGRWSERRARPRQRRTTRERRTAATRRRRATAARSTRFLACDRPLAIPLAAHRYVTMQVLRTVELPLVGVQRIARRRGAMDRAPLLPPHRTRMRCGPSPRTYVGA